MKSRKNIFETHIILSLATCFMLFLYAPLELFFLNQGEFFYDVYVLIPPIFCTFLVFLGVSLGMFFIMKKTKWYYQMLCIYFVCFICSYMQGSFMTGWLPSINGDIVVWSEFSLERIKSILIWIIATVIIVIVHKKAGKDCVEKVIRYSSAVIGGILLLSIIMLCITTGGYHKKQIMSTATAHNILTVSEDENFIILVLDAVDATVMSQVLAEDIEYQKIFDDFTYYTNAMSGYPYTIHSIPLILTGEWYEKQCEFDEFTKTAYSNSPLFMQLENDGYRMGIYETGFMVDASEQNRFDNILDCKRGVNSWFTFCRWQIQLTGYRYAPFDLKRFCYVYVGAFDGLKVLPAETELFECDNSFFWDKLCDEELDVVDDKCFRFIHVGGAHSPYRYDENMNISDESSYEDGVKACLTMTNKYLEKLKIAGVYDNSCIIIMADHGHVAGFNDNPILFVIGYD